MSIGSISGAGSLFHLQQLQQTNRTQQAQAASLDSDNDGDTDLGGVDNNDGTSNVNEASVTGKGQYIDARA